LSAEHPFAQYVRIVGKGRHGARSLTAEEAHAAMAMIIRGEAEPVQIGAFLMLIRVREETPEEAAGFVSAARNAITRPDAAAPVRIDWPAYAGKRRQLPWFVLSALLLAGSGYPVLMHGIRGQDQRVYASQALAALGIRASATLSEAAQEISRSGFAYIALEKFCPVVHHLIELRPLLGLRSPMHTVARMLNPLDAAVQLQGIFHPNYRDIHQQAALLLKQPHMAVLKGEGGETERNPDVPCLVQSVHHGVEHAEEWPAMFAARHLKDESMDPGRLPALWRGETTDEYGEAAVIGTAAIALRALGVADSIAAAEAQAAELWRRRPATWLKAA
jgi:anthranilate phosphoribosyltransferase